MGPLRRKGTDGAGGRQKEDPVERDDQDSRNTRGSDQTASESYRYIEGNRDRRVLGGIKEWRRQSSRG